MGEQSQNRHELTRAERLKGAASGRLTRAVRPDAWAWSVADALHGLAAEIADDLDAQKAQGKPLSLPFALSELTNDQIAACLGAAPFHIAAPEGGKLIGKNVHKALDRLGISNAIVKKWRKKARDFAVEHDVNPQLMIFQLWHEWKRHEALNDKLGLTLTERAESPFKPDFKHPSAWVPPWVRNPDPELYAPRLGFLLLCFGLCEPTKDEWKEEIERA